MYSKRVKPSKILDARPHRSRRFMEVDIEVPMVNGIKSRQTFTVKVKTVKTQLGIRNPRETPDRMVGRSMVIPEIQNQLHKAGHSVPPLRVRERCTHG